MGGKGEIGLAKLARLSGLKRAQVRRLLTAIVMLSVRGYDIKLPGIGVFSERSWEGKVKGLPGKHVRRRLHFTCARSLKEKMRAYDERKEKEQKG